MTALYIFVGIASSAAVLGAIISASDSWAKQWQRAVPFRGTVQSSASVSRPERERP